jgi:uncharacterized membrane protein
MLGGLNTPLLHYLRDIYTALYGWMLKANGREDYPHLLALMLFGMTLSMNVVSLGLLIAYPTGWNLGPLFEQPKVLAVVSFAVPSVAYAFGLRGRDHDADLQRLHAAGRAGTVGRALALYFIVSYVALGAAFALYVFGSPA